MNQAIVGRVVAAVLALVASGAVGWRVFAPAEVLAPATDPYPAAPARSPGLTGQTAAMPLIVDGRLRVYAAARQVRADGPVDAKTYGTPRWSFRRWPEQLNGVVAVGPTVLTRWSDGELVALDARTGTVAWRTDGPPADGYDGRRTGASAVTEPRGLHTVGSSVVVSGGRVLLVLDATTGAVRHRSDLPGDCAADGFTTAGGGYACGGAAFDVATGRRLPAWPTGRATAVGCAVARSACTGMRDGAGRGWLVTAAAPRRAPALDRPGSTVAGGLVLTDPAAAGAAVVARSPVTGVEVWRWTAPAGETVAVLAAQRSVVHLLTGARVLVTLDAATGVPRSQFVLNKPKESLAWIAGSVQATAGMVAVERLRDPVDEALADADYYFSVDTVILAAT